MRNFKMIRRAEMIWNYCDTNKSENKRSDNQKIGRSCCGLKDINLNVPQYLNCFTFPEVKNEILKNKILGLPLIVESGIPFWLARVKAILFDLVGFGDGPYYDFLAVNAYGRQQNEEIRLLTEK